ncbi:hypothetical protein GGI12_000143 [Dipsacomyces acuminosporus]|nr:hypothetical protein GGI12_000143 [Dipsacomyces acuminosporus]
MVSLVSLVAPIMAVLGTVHAGFYTTYPVGADGVNPGQTITIQWKPDSNEPVLNGVKSYTLKFMTGGNIVQTTVQTIGTFDITKTSIPFTIPQTAPGMYFLMYTADNGAGSSWSTRFSVSGGTTWYPKGVATGVDPGTTPTETIVPPSSSASTSKPVTSGGASSSAPSSQPSKPASTTDGASATPTSGAPASEPTGTGDAPKSKSKSKSKAGSTSAAEPTTDDATTTDAEPTTDAYSSAPASKTEASSEEPASKPASTSSKNGAAARGCVSLVALVAASALLF